MNDNEVRCCICDRTMCINDAIQCHNLGKVTYECNDTEFCHLRAGITRNSLILTPEPELRAELKPKPKAEVKVKKKKKKRDWLFPSFLR